MTVRTKMAINTILISIITIKMKVMEINSVLKGLGTFCIFRNANGNAMRMQW